MRPDHRGSYHWLVWLGGRLGWLLAVLLAGGLLGATLVRLAPGFGADERMLDARLSDASLRAVEQSRAEGSDIFRYYCSYLVRLSRGDLGSSVSLGKPVGELIRERFPLTAKSLISGLLLAWAAALLVIPALELLGCRSLDVAASVVSGSLLCVPAAVLALGCLHLGGSPALAIGAIIFPRVYRYVRDLGRAAYRAPHVLAAHAMGVNPLRILFVYVAAPVLPELLALAGISVSMAVGATIPVEALCDSPGLGSLVWQAALARDLPVLVIMTLLITAVIAAANLIGEGDRHSEAEA